MAVVHPVKSLIIIFEDMFPQYKDPENIYNIHGVNGIKIKNPMHPLLIFRYINKSQWELTTFENDEKKVEALTELRAQLDIAQKQLNNYKRRKK